MSVSKKRIVVYKYAFEIARRCGKLKEVYDLKEKYGEIFKKVKILLGKRITNKIDSFNPIDKGILLVGSDDYLIRGAAAYAWFQYITGYTDDTTDIENIWLPGTKKILKPEWFWHENYQGVEEQEIRKDLAPEIGSLDDCCYTSKVLFFENINTEYIHLLNRLARTMIHLRPAFRVLKGTRDQKAKEEKYGGRKKYGIKDIIIKSRLMILSVDKIDRLSQSFLNRFEIINLEPDKQKKKSKRSPNLPDKQIMNAFSKATRELGEGSKVDIRFKRTLEIIQLVHKDKKTYSSWQMVKKRYYEIKKKTK